MSDDPIPTEDGGDIVRFPQSRTTPPGGAKPIKVIGQGAMAAVIGVPNRQSTGHWCSRCKGIWYGYLLEVTCPVCGSRHG